jgi:hypothetical protein
VLEKELAAWRRLREMEAKERLSERWRLRVEAIRSLADLYAAAQKCCEAHDAAGLEIPTPVMRLLDAATSE